MKTEMFIFERTKLWPLISFFFFFFFFSFFVFAFALQFVGLFGWNDSIGHIYSNPHTQPHFMTSSCCIFCIIAVTMQCLSAGCCMENRSVSLSNRMVHLCPSACVCGCVCVCAARPASLYMCSKQIFDYGPVAESGLSADLKIVW